MKRYIEKIQGMSIGEIIKKVLKKIKNEIIWFINQVKLKKHPLEENYINLKKFNKKFKFFFNVSDRNHYIAELEELELTKDIIDIADNICLHKFNILGSGEINLGKRIKWNEDFKSGFVWENKYYKRIKIVDIYNDSDVKVPWELSRFQHITTLGQAYLITDDIKYFNEFQDEVLDWINENPVNMSVNWTCAMEVAIRACNWIVGMEYFSNIIDQDLLRLMNKWLYLHGDFIFKNLEKESISNNHYLSNLAGLFWIGLYFRNFKEKKDPEKWLKFAKLELEKEILLQVYEDGCSYEGSTAYHCFVTEILLFTSILGSYNENPFSDIFNLRIEKMSEVMMNITKPNGLIPLIGDMDSGRFVTFSHYGSLEKRDFRYLLRVAGEYFNRNDFRYHSSDISTAIWLFPNISKNEFKINRLKSVSYPYGGWHILRNKSIYLIINCRNSNIKGSGGHIHNDQLSIEVNIDSYDVIIDPGTYVYTADYKMRNFFRSVSQHNTVMIDNLEQSPYNQINLFSVFDETNPSVIEFKENYFKGSHNGYKENLDITIIREIVIKENSIKIADYIKSEKICKSTKTVSYIFDNMIIIENDKIILPNGKEVQFKSNKPLEFSKHIEETYISKEYGDKTSSTKLSWDFTDEYNETVITY